MSRPDLLSTLGSLLGCGISPARFREWHAEAKPDIEAVADDDELDLARSVEHRFAEYTGGHIDAAAPIAAIRADVTAHSAGLPAAIPHRAPSIA